MKLGTDSDNTDWRDQAIDNVRELIKIADPEVVEEIKWRKPSNGMKGVPVWTHDGMICTGETYKDKVKLTFANGAALHDPSRLFNASDTGNTRRAIDIDQHYKLDGPAFSALVHSAVDFNQAKKSEKSK